jgi:hypothetical protein
MPTKKEFPMRQIVAKNKIKLAKSTFSMIIIATCVFAIQAYSMGGGGNMRNCAMDQNVVQTNFASLNNEQKKELLYIYQEEKMARDVYMAMHKLYPNEITFANIIKSEQRHMDMAEMLCKRYGVDISNIDQSQYGKFIVPELQKLHDTLILQGKKNAKEALRAGELIEVTDISDIDKMLPLFKNYSDINTILVRLKEASKNHLHAFRNSIRFAS